MTRLRADVYPANLAVAPPGAPRATSLRVPTSTSSTKYLQNVRVLVTQDSVIVLKDSHKGPEVIFYERLQDYTPPPPRPSRLRDAMRVREAQLTTDSGKTLAFHRGGGCGCGSQLKTFNVNQLLQSESLSLASTRDL